jgi:toxin ParE1/3/4
MSPIARRREPYACGPEFTDLLLRHPLAGAVTDEPTIRRIATTPYPYLVFYEATDAEIIVHAVRHGAREPSDDRRSE